MFFKNTRVSQLTAVCIFSCFCYLPFLLCEALELSGIVGVVAASISMRRYASKNVSEATKKQASFVFAVASSLAETASFVLLGLSVFSQTWANYNFKFIAVSAVTLLMGRVLSTYPLLGLGNLVRRMRAANPTDDCNGDVVAGRPRSQQQPAGTLVHGPLKTNTIHLVTFSGTLRGAVSFSYVFCSMFFLSFLFVMDLSLSLSLFLSLLLIHLLLPACILLHHMTRV
jgi:NhaP-type Na+/H+ or K+/H+ antiporter